SELVTCDRSTNPVAAANDPAPCPAGYRVRLVVSMPSNSNEPESALATRTTRSVRAAQPDVMTPMAPSAGGAAAVATPGLALEMADTAMAAPRAVDTEKMV